MDVLIAIEVLATLTRTVNKGGGKHHVETPWTLEQRSMILITLTKAGRGAAMLNSECRKSGNLVSKENVNVFKAVRLDVGFQCIEI